ncbi:MerR family transcriptional regulator [Actinomadura spongiicola]|uniref:MerR family transcriptional regulator n=2 Tax=Actinomadura spongiicola TaxID=2303421 RepID=A0A372GPZ8_9ACTN|nr:MerR family transcriptional regulator [Actinomadura spongiicola]
MWAQRSTEGFVNPTPPAQTGSHTEHQDPRTTPSGSEQETLADAGVTPEDTRRDTPGSPLDDKLDDEDYPAYSMGRAADILGVTPAFLRSLDAAELFVPQRSAGGHRRYSRYQLHLAQRARDLVNQGTALDAACRIIILEDQLAEAQRLNAELQRRVD